jgi:hypothetical protein
MSDRRIINVNVRLNADTWFRWKVLAHAHGVAVERATEVLIREALRQNGIDIEAEESRPVRAPGPMVRP